MTKRILSGFQASGRGELHIGNYCGAVYPIKKALRNKTIQEEEVYMMIADLHAMTVHSQDLNRKSFHMVKNLYAFHLGKKVNIYIQSHLDNFCKSFWLLSNFATTGEMNRMTQFKEKKLLNNSNIGLYTYPILMAADILYIDADLVSVGEDQLQHLEETRNIAHRFNTYKPDTFKIPLPFITTTYRIRSLTDVTKKMSKTTPEGCLFLMDSEEVIRDKIKKAQTDSELFPSTFINMQERPAAYNLAVLYAICGEIPMEDVISTYQGYTWKNFKEALLQVVVPFCLEFQKNYNNIDDEELLKELSITTEKMNKIVKEKLNASFSFFM